MAEVFADPIKQWRTGFSAKTLAHCWEASIGLPTEISSILQPLGSDPELLLAIPEFKVALPGSNRGESQNDIFVLARAGTRTIAMMVEGKVREPFGQTVGDWLRGASEGKRERLSFICDLLGISLPVPDHIHYQLLHRTASALIEAHRFKTDVAAMIVHGFSQERIWLESFQQFAQLFQVAIPSEIVNSLINVRPNTQPPLYIGWACGDCNFLRV